MLCANLGFTDNYGYRSSDILGQVVTSLGPAESRWEEELASIQERVERLTEEAARAVADAAQKGRGSSQRDRAVGMRGSMDKADARHSAEDGTHQEDALASLRFHFSERVRHKFSRAVIPVEVVVALGGTDTTRLLEMTITPTEVQDGVAVFDTAGRLVYVNKEVETLLHYRPGMMLRKEITLDRCLPPPYNQFHSKQLKDLFVRAEQPGLDIPCYNNHVIPMVGRGKRLTAARMRWWPSKDTGPLLFVSVISAPPADPLAGLWEAEGPQGAINRQICLRVVTTAHGKVVAVGGGVGFHRRGLPGDVFGMDASSMLGESLSSYVDMMDTAVRNAQRYNAGVTTEQVMEEFIGSLSAKARALDIASYRACFIADDSGDEDATVPIRLVVQPVSSSPLRLSALADHGVLLKDHATPGAIAALEEEGYVFEIWSSNWLNADLTLSRDLAIRAVSPALEVMCGRRAKALAGKPASELLTESGLEGLEGVVKGSAREMCEIKHLDGSAIGVSVAGAQKQVGQREVQVLLRGVLEEGSSAMESLRRAEGLLALETGRAKEDGPRKSKGKVSFGQGVVEKDERKERKESGDGGAEVRQERGRDSTGSRRLVCVAQDTLAPRPTSFERVSDALQRLIGAGDRLAGRPATQTMACHPLPCDSRRHAPLHRRNQSRHAASLPPRAEGQGGRGGRRRRGGGG